MLWSNVIVMAAVGDHDDVAGRFGLSRLADVVPGGDDDATGVGDPVDEQREGALVCSLGATSKCSCLFCVWI